MKRGIIIAEIGINHNGDIDLAYKMIDAAQEAGADYVKFQLRDVDTVYAGQLDKPRNDGNPYGWETQGDQKRGIEFSLEQYKLIDSHCESIGMPWFGSCWDLKSLEMVEKHFDWPYHKVASAMATNHEFLEAVAQTNKPVIISTGGCDLDQIEAAVDHFIPFEIILMHCVCWYPCPEERLNLRRINTLMDEFPFAQVGYSGHEVGLYPSVMAIAMGARYIERHFTLDRSMYGSDQSASIEPAGLAKLCQIAHSANKILGHGEKAISNQEMVNIKKLRYWEK